MTEAPPSPISPDRIREAVGQSETSRQLHQQRTSSVTASPVAGASLEQFTAESRVYQSLINKAVVLGGLQGCAAAAISFGVMRSVASRAGTAAGLSGLRMLCQSTLMAAIPTGLALAYTSCSGIYHERKFREFERSREEWEMKNYLEGERDEMIKLYAARGIDAGDATTIVDILLKNETVFLDIMMTEELGYSRYPPPNAVESVIKVGLPTAISFVITAGLPHIPVLILALKGDGIEAASRGTKAGEALLAVQSVLLSMLQAKLLLGAYTTFGSTAQLAAVNGCWVFGCYHVSSALKSLCCRISGCN